MELRIRDVVACVLILGLLTGCAPTVTRDDGALDCAVLAPLPTVAAAIHEPESDVSSVSLRDDIEEDYLSITATAFLRSGFGECSVASEGPRVLILLLADSRAEFETAADSLDDAMVAGLGDAAFATCSTEVFEACAAETRVGDTWLGVVVQGSPDDREAAIEIAHGILPNLGRAGRLPTAPRAPQRPCDTLADEKTVAAAMSTSTAHLLDEPAYPFIGLELKEISGGLTRAGYTDCQWSSTTNGSTEVQIRVLPNAAGAQLPVADATAPFTLDETSVPDLGDEAVAGCGDPAVTIVNCAVVIRAGDDLIDVTTMGRTAEASGSAGVIALARIVLARLQAG